MIPLKLVLHNFMCYRGPVTLDFRGVELACLSGENGHGKSAILDAITWALWGKARARDDELIHLGLDEMKVELEFLHKRNRYRVVRMRSKAGKGRSELHFHIWDPARKQFRPLTESSKARTQERINELLRMDYDTFINSAFLLQGRANEFTTKPPRERKRILGEILGLDLYDRLEERAKERLKEKEKEEASIEGQLRYIEAELSKEQEHRTQLAEAQLQVEKLEERLEAAERELDFLTERLRELEAQERELQEARERLRGEEQEIQGLMERIRAGQNRIRQYEAFIQREDEIQAGVRRWEEVQKRIREIESKVGELASIRDEAAELSRIVTREQAAIEKEMESLEEQIRDWREELKRKEFHERELAEVRAQLKKLDELRQRVEQLKDRVEEAEREKAGLEGENRKAKEEMQLIKEQLEMLKVAGANCPLCGQPLSEEERGRLLDELQSKGESLGASYRGRKARIKELVEYIKGAREELSRLQELLQRRDGLHRKEARLSELLRQMGEKERALQEAGRRVATLKEKLAREDYALEARRKLKSLEEKLRLLHRYEEALKQLRREGEELARWSEERVRLEEARSRLEVEKENIEALEKSLARRQEFKAQEEARIQRLLQALQGLESLRQRVQEKHSALESLQRELREARDQVAAHRQFLAYIEQLRKEKEALEERLRRIREEKGIYRELKETFGKQGVQAMIIESLLPELEAEANRLLSKMTDGRMHVRFDTQKFTKKGTVQETLEIKIADELGNRDYRLYSGGESFRVDFAIRVALAKLLARRSGAPLASLFIDEGFGTQDAKGREKLIEAINSIRDEFQFILVVTHIEELKEAFPVRIEVRKTPEGSVVTVE